VSFIDPFLPFLLFVSLSPPPSFCYMGPRKLWSLDGTSTCPEEAFYPGKLGALLPPIWRVFAFPLSELPFFVPVPWVEQRVSPVLLAFFLRFIGKDSPLLPSQVGGRRRMEVKNLPPFPRLKLSPLSDSKTFTVLGPGDSVN